MLSGPARCSAGILNITNSKPSFAQPGSGTRHIPGASKSKKIMARKKKLPMITASEVAEFIFCAKAWQLKRIGEVAESVHLAPGKEFHERHNAWLSFASLLRRVGLAAALLACLLLIVAMLLRD